MTSRIPQWYIILILASLTWGLTACQEYRNDFIDRLNEKAYSFRYKDLDSTKHIAQQALKSAGRYSAGRAEALNNLAFVQIAKMRYKEAEQTLQRVYTTTDNQVELLVADVQGMRICQRQSRNKDFYEYMERGKGRLSRIREESEWLTPHQRRRMVYANTELDITASTYFYYVGLPQQSLKALEDIDPVGSIQQDTTQQLAYLYNIGSGGILQNSNPQELAQDEFRYLTQCYFLAVQGSFVFWEAQALQSMGEHLLDVRTRKGLIQQNANTLKYINLDNMPDSLLAGYLAQRALTIFQRFGDVYQVSGAYRTLAQCYWSIGDYRSAMYSLRRALKPNHLVEQAPDLVASIREQLCLVYSAVDDKANSDYNRNVYLDLQEKTRQDRLLEARASQLDEAVEQLNWMLLAVILVILLVLVLLFVFGELRRKSDARFSLDTLLEPLRQWEKRNAEKRLHVQSHYEEVCEQQAMQQLELIQTERRHSEQRAKVSLVCLILPLIDRITHELELLVKRNEPEETRQRRYDYIAEVTETIQHHNDVLTQWIQMRQGSIGMKIETFKLQDIFDVLQHGRTSFMLKGVELQVEPTLAEVKADKTLTLFMINTIADNARKHTSQGGKVVIKATQSADYVEISVQDTGCGMSEEQLSHIFDRTYMGGHGFGLKNCNGIIEHYRKVSRIFSVCRIGAESEVGNGSRVFFCLPRGGAVRPAVPSSVSRAILLFALSLGVSCSVMAAAQLSPAKGQKSRYKHTTNPRAAQWADSAYYSNISGTYARTLQFSDSCHQYLNPTDTAIILDISNETAVAALALHKWDLYHKSNGVYTRLFRQASADDTLPDYVAQMQRSKANKNVAIVLLILLLISIFPAYYLLYYRHRLGYRYCIDRINAMNGVLAREVSNDEKLQAIDRLADWDGFHLAPTQRRSLEEIVAKIRHALQLSVGEASLQQETLEVAEDQLRRLRMDNEKLYVANSVLDNCLSTLKHETMYYPSRIAQLVDEGDKALDGMVDLAAYYQTLYASLAQQALRQLPPPRLSAGYVGQLVDLLRGLTRGKQVHLREKTSMSSCTLLEVKLEGLSLSSDQAEQLFTPYTHDLRFLVARQLVREMGELTSQRACGMEVVNNAPLVIHITLPTLLYNKDRKLLQTL